jgi:hypothetical protein
MQGDQSYRIELLNWFLDCAICESIRVFLSEREGGSFHLVSEPYSSHGY